MKPELVIPVGIPASGKSTLSEKYWDHVPISPDQIRREVFGVEYDKEVEAMVWEIAFELLECYTKARANVYFDATNISKWARAKLIKAVDRRTYNVVAHYLPCSIKTALKRNLGRSRRVPEEVIVGMAERLEEPTLDEGFKEIRVGS